MTAIYNYYVNQYQILIYINYRLTFQGIYYYIINIYIITFFGLNNPFNNIFYLHII